MSASGSAGELLAHGIVVLVLGVEVASVAVHLEVVGSVLNLAAHPTDTDKKDERYVNIHHS